MRTRTTKLLGTLAATFAVSALAQVPGTPPAAGQPGFFRPSPDPAITAFRPLPTPGAPAPATPVQGAPAGTPAPAPQPVADPELERRMQVEAEARARLEAQMDRIETANMRAIAQARAETRLPVIASPLEGTAPILSPLDGTAPIVSPISR